MSKFEDLVNDFNGMTPEEKLYWMERIIQSFNLREKLDLSKSLRDLISKAVTAPPPPPPVKPTIVMLKEGSLRTLRPHWSAVGQRGR